MTKPDERGKMKTPKKIAIWLGLVLAAYLILFHTPWIICYTNTYKKWYRIFLSIEAGKPYNAHSIILIETDAVVREYIGLYQAELFDTLFWTGKIKREQVSRFQSLVSRQGSDLIIVNTAPLMELPDDYERECWIKGMDGVRRGDRSVAVRERAFFEFAMLHFRRIIFQNPFNKTSGTADDVLEIAHWP
jgi:hypothetical protein